MRAMPDECIDLTISSPPYDGLRHALGFMETGFRLHDTMIYSKTGIRFPECNRYYPCFEFMFVFSKGKPKTTNLIKDRRNKGVGVNRQATGEPQPDGTVRRPQRRHTTEEFGVRRNIWEYSPGMGKTAPDSLWVAHPAAFPLQLAADHIQSWSNPGDVVFDPMVGSGQTCLAARNLGRHWIGFDVAQEYVDLAHSRLTAAAK